MSVFLAKQAQKCSLKLNLGIHILSDYGTKYNFLEMAQSDSKMIQKLPNWAKNDWNWPQNDLNTT